MKCVLFVYILIIRFSLSEKDFPRNIQTPRIRATRTAETEMVVQFRLRQQQTIRRGKVSDRRHGGQRRAKTDDVIGGPTGQILGANFL